jgi:hypothetical protein
VQKGTDYKELQYLLGRKKMQTVFRERKYGASFKYLARIKHLNNDV